jgi:hypothetical protein
MTSVSHSKRNSAGNELTVTLRWSLMNSDLDNRTIVLKDATDFSFGEILR